jgi:hypothetical protein
MFTYLLGDREAKSDPLLINMKSSLELPENLEQVLLIFLRYSHARVYYLHDKLTPAIGIKRDGLIRWLHADLFFKYII